MVYYNSYFLHRYQKVGMTTKVDLLATNSVPPIVPQEVAKESHAYNPGMKQSENLCCSAWQV